MTISITRAWLAFAAIGAGMIHLALVVGSPLPLAAAPALLGAAELGWGVAVLMRAVLAIAAGALVVGAVTTPALAATEAGRQAQPHGAHVMQPEPAPAPGGHAGH